MYQRPLFQLSKGLSTIVAMRGISTKLAEENNINININNNNNNNNKYVSPELEQKTSDIFALRRSPKSLYENAMHSNTLSDHPLTHRTSRDELSYRKRKLTERGNYEQAAKAEEEAEQRDKEGKAGAETREYYSAIGFVVLGYLAAHGVIFKIFYPNDIRPNYLPDRGYSDEVAARRRELEEVDEFVGIKVLESVYSKRKASVKGQLV